MFSVVGCSVAITDMQQTSEELKIECTSLFSHYSSEGRRRSVHCSMESEESLWLSQQARTRAYNAIVIMSGGPK